MNPAELHKRVAEVLGVSASQNELAFDVLIESVSDILTEGITLKIPRIGFFQLKSDSHKNNPQKQLIYSSLPEDFDPSEKILYHTFEVNTKYKNPSEIDSQVFSIGVGKPLLPLYDEESQQDSETSFAMLRKSIEERVREILAESDQIPNFNIWEDIYSNSEEESSLDEDISSRLLDLTKDLHFEEESKYNEPDIEPQHQNFLNSLLYSEKPKASEEFFAEEKNQDLPYSVNFIEEELSVHDLNNMDDSSSNDNLTVSDLLGDTDWKQKNEPDELFIQGNIITEEDNNNDDSLESPEKLEITIPDSFSEHVKIEIDEENSLSIQNELQNNIDPMNFEEEKNEESVYSNWTEQEAEIDIEKIENEDMPDSYDGDVLRSLLDDNEPAENSVVEKEIAVEPPSSAKELLINLKDGYSDPLKNAWTIAEEDLKGIINDELKEYDHEKIANDNSRVLNDLLEDAFHRKVDMDSTDEFEEEEHIEEKNEQSTSDEKIEWSWGDELKEEFGIGQNDEITEIEKESFNGIEDDETIQPKVSSFKFDLEQTRQDLFSKLEKTLEKEVTSLHENYSEVKSEQVSQKTQLEKYSSTKTEFSSDNNKNVFLEDAKNPVVEFKDEKVILDFKTPPPRYEFIEETPEQNIEQDFPDEPILTKPKRMTILLERNELEEAVTRVVEQQSNEVGDLENQVAQKNSFGKLFITAVAAFIVITSIVVYIYVKSLSTDNEKVANNQTSSVENSNVNTTADPVESVRSTRESLGLNPDDFSEFPTTATPPEPVKEGTTVDLSSLLPKTADANVVKNEEIVKQSQKENLTNKPASNSKPQGETRLNEMIFFDGKSYNFQVSSWKNKFLAQSEVDRLRSLGYNAFLVEAYLPDKGGTWYRIRIGTFKSEKEAFDFKNKNSF